MKAVSLLLIIVLLLAVTSVAGAEEIERKAIIVDMIGDVKVKPISEDTWMQARSGMTLNQGAIIRTAIGSKAIIRLDGEPETAMVEMRENSQLTLSEMMGSKQNDSQSTLLDLALGEILIKAKKIHSEKSKFEVRTPTSFIGIRGTIFSVSVRAVE